MPRVSRSWTGAQVHRLPRDVLAQFEPSDIGLIAPDDLIVLASAVGSRAVRYMCPWCRARHRRDGQPDNRCRAAVHEHGRTAHAVTREPSHCPHVTGNVWVVAHANAAA